MNRRKQKERVKSRGKNVTAATLSKKTAKSTQAGKNMPGICLSQGTNGAQGKGLCFTVP